MKNSKFTLFEEFGETVLIEARDVDVFALLKNDQYLRIGGYGCKLHISQHGA